MDSTIKDDINDILRNIGALFMVLFIIGSGYTLVTGERLLELKNPENQQSKIINRIDLLTCQGEIFGTFYFFEADQENEKGWVIGNHARFIDYRGRKIQYSGNYLVTPIPDTLSVNSDQ